MLIGSAGCCLARALLVRRERLPWLILGAAIVVWTIGDLYYYYFLTNSANVPIPSVSDAFYLAFYPISYAALAVLLRGRIRKFQGNLWLDGLIGASAVGALGAAIVFDKVLSTTGGSALVIATGLAYPLADLLLLALIVAMFALTGWRVDRTWALVAAGYAVFAVADTTYLYQTAVDRYVEGGVLDVAWPAAIVLIACAAWQPVTRLQEVRTDSWKTLTLPTFFALVSLTLLVYDHFVRINVVAIVLASAAIGMVIVRAVLTFRERVRTAGDHARGIAHGRPHRSRQQAQVRLAISRSASPTAPRTSSWSSSTWTASRPTTTRSATPPAMRCSHEWPKGWPKPPSRPGAHTGSVGTSSASSRRSTTPVPAPSSNARPPP